MSALRTAAQQALDALYRWHMTDGETAELMPAFEVLRAALAEPVQEPVAWASKRALARIKDFDSTIYANGGFDDAVPLYTAPPQRKPLTEEEIEALADAVPIDEMTLNPSTWHLKLARAIERAHGIGEGND